MGDIRSYRDLEVRKEAMRLAKDVYEATKLFPKEETFSISNQMRRAAVSISSNIAEGQGRNGTKEFIQFLCIARGSLNELMTQVSLSNEIGYLSHDKYDRMDKQSSVVGRLLNGLIRSLR